METRIERSLQSTWDDVRALRQFVGAELAHVSEDLQAAAVMASAELIENAVKHGEALEDPGTVDFTLVHTADEIHIETINRIGSVDAYVRLKTQIDQIIESGDGEELYMERLADYLADETARGSLGLYRIAFEGGFRLACSCVNDAVKVTATRNTRP